MKYLTNELYIACYYKITYDVNKDKFLIGYLNKSGNKLKDVITGQIVENSFYPLSSLKSFKNGGNDMALGFMTGLKSANASVGQRVKAKMIDSILSNDVLNKSQISKIKEIMNKQIKNTYKKNEALNKKDKELQQYSIEDSERDF